tara:strand:- start:4781 stop:6670 length:1890 start_codon:yes stop_codon:yes gene_type:complete
LSKTLIFIDQPNEVELIDKNILNSEETTIYSFDIRTHYFLDEKKISHIIGERVLQQKDLFQIFDTVVSLWDWFKKRKEFCERKIYGLNPFGMLDTAEFHNLLIKEVYLLLTMKRILEDIKPNQIFVNEHFGKVLQQKCIDKNIEINLINGIKHEFTISWESFPVELKIGNFSFSLPLSRSLILKTKNTIDKFQDKFQKFSLNKNFKKKIILFLEINPKTYSQMFEQLSSNEKQIVILNRRKPILDIDSLKILSKNNIKLIHPSSFLSNDDKKYIKNIEKQFLEIITDTWKNNKKIFDEIFSIEDMPFWGLIDKILFELYQKRVYEYSELIILAKNIHEMLDIQCIIHHNYLGETEKAILDFESKKINAIMLQHAYANYTSNDMRYDVFDTSIFKDKIALWGKKQASNLLMHKKIPHEKIILSGSPRHDIFFKQTKTKQSKNKSVLITTQNFEWTNAQLNTDIFLNIEILFKKIFQIIENLPEKIDLIIKIHPAKDPYNEFLKERIKKINPNIQILQSEPSRLLIANCDVLINIHSELIPSTTMLEGLILRKPVLNITLIKDKIFDYDEINAVYSVYHNKLDKKDFEKILFDPNFQINLKTNGEKYINSFLEVPGNASSNFVRIINETCS